MGPLIRTICQLNPRQHDHHQQSMMTRKAMVSIGLNIHMAQCSTSAGSTLTVVLNHVMLSN
jgi:hypothetical protein